MARIEDIAFGKLLCGGKVYRSDCIVTRESVNGRWWRQSGTEFLPEDFKELPEAKPEYIIIGRGFVSKVTIPPETQEYLKDQGMECEIFDTPEAVERFNALFDKGKTVIGAFHLM